MKLHLADFKEDVAKNVQCDYSPEELDIEFEDLKYQGPLALEAVVEKGHDVLKFTGTLKASLTRVCGRCLEEFPESIEKQFRFFYDIKDKTDVDTTDDIREQVALDHPMVFRCSNKACQSAYAAEEPEEKLFEKKGTHKPFESLKNLRSKLKEDNENGTS